MKTVIHIWKQDTTKYRDHYPNYITFLGLGDLIRGSIYLFNLCEKHNYNFIVDLSLHPLASCFVNREHQFSNKVKNDTIYAVVWSDIDSFVQSSLEDNECVLLSTNGAPRVYNTLRRNLLRHLLKNY